MGLQVHMPSYTVVCTVLRSNHSIQASEFILDIVTTPPPRGVHSRVVLVFAILVLSLCRVCDHLQCEDSLNVEC